MGGGRRKGGRAGKGSDVGSPPLPRGMPGTERRRRRWLHGQRERGLALRRRREGPSPGPALSPALSPAPSVRWTPLTAGPGPKTPPCGSHLAPDHPVVSSLRAGSAPGAAAQPEGLTTECLPSDGTGFGRSGQWLPILNSWRFCCILCVFSAIPKGRAFFSACRLLSVSAFLVPCEFPGFEGRSLWAGAPELSGRADCPTWSHC